MMRVIKSWRLLLPSMVLFVSMSFVMLVTLVLPTTVTSEEVFDRHGHSDGIGSAECRVDANSGERVCGNSDDVDVAESSEDIPCVDEHELCPKWAEIGECDANPNYMKQHCQKSCNTCPLKTEYDNMNRSNEDNAEMKKWCDSTLAFGERQISNGSEDTEKLIMESVLYMRDLVDDNLNLSVKVKSECKNRHDMCAFWAAIGECDVNPSYMVTNCAPSCKSCHLIDFDTRCPLRDEALRPGLQKGGLNAMFERIVTSNHTNITTATYTVHVHSRPNPPVDSGIPDGPWVVTLDDFLTNEECDTLVKLGGDVGYLKSKDVGAVKFDGSFDSYESKGRTSENAWCSDKDGCRKNTVVARVMRRMADVTQIPPEHSEDFQLLRYDVGQFYRAHHDYIEHQKHRQCGPRILTFFLYLSDVEAGGGTAYPDMNNLTVVPKKGRALLWPSVLDEDPSEMDGRTRHEALTVWQGRKYAANAWIHLYDYVTPQKFGCV